MAITCHVIIEDEIVPEGQAYRQMVFEVIANIGETVVFSRDGTRDTQGILHPEHFTVKNVWHVAGDDKANPMTFLILART